jgi:uncharacterized protein YkwD
MRGAHSSDTREVAPDRRAPAAAHRRLLLAALLALCVCAWALSSRSLASASASAANPSAAARMAASHTTHRRPRSRQAPCARRTSFRTSHPKRRKKRHSSCRHVKKNGSTNPNSHKRKSAHHVSAVHSSECPDADLRPTNEDLERIRVATLCLVNGERTGHGEPALTPDGRLQKSAQGHSEDMASGDYFDHVGPRGDTPLSRMRAVGYVSDPHAGFEVGENIAWATLWLATPRAIVAAWMESPGHRANILDANFRETGVGVSPHPISSLAHGQAGAIYTQDFGVITG